MDLYDVYALLFSYLLRNKVDSKYEVIVVSSKNGIRLSFEDYLHVFEKGLKLGPV